MIRSNLLDDAVGDVLSALLEDAGDVPLIVNPSRDTITELVRVLAEAEDPPRARLFAAEGPLKDLMDDFLVASAVADLVEMDRLTVKTLPAQPNNALVLTGESLVSLVVGPDRAAGLVTTEESFLSELGEYYESQWETAPEFSLRTPPLSEVTETLAEVIGPAAAADFEAVLDSLETARGNGKGLDEVTISLLVAARNGKLLYDISRWGEDIGLASKATFSRTKTRLEDSGLVDTEKVPIDVGRPRLRLMLDDERLEEADIDDLAAVAQELLA